MREEEIIRLRKRYQEMPDKEIIEMLLEGREGCEEGVYDLVLEESKRRGIDSEVVAKKKEEKRKKAQRSSLINNCIYIIILSIIGVGGFNYARERINNRNMPILIAEFLPRYEELIEQSETICEECDRIWYIAKKDTTNAKNEIGKLSVLMKNFVKEYKELLSIRHPYALMIRLKSNEWYSSHSDRIKEMEKLIETLRDWEKLEKIDLNKLYLFCTQCKLHKSLLKVTGIKK